MTKFTQSDVIGGFLTKGAWKTLRYKKGREKMYKDKIIKMIINIFIFSIIITFSIAVSTWALTAENERAFLKLNYQEMVPLRAGLMEVEVIAAPDPGAFNQHHGWPVAGLVGEDIFVAFFKKRSHHNKYAYDNSNLPCTKVRFDDDSGEYLLHSLNGGRSWEPIHSLTDEPPIAHDVGWINECEKLYDPNANLGFGFALGSFGSIDDLSEKGLVMLSRNGQRKWLTSTGKWEAVQGLIERHNYKGQKITMGPRIVEVPLPSSRQCGSGRLLLAFGNRSAKYKGTEMCYKPNDGVNLDPNLLPQPTLHVFASIDDGESWKEWMVSFETEPTIRPCEPTALYLPEIDPNDPNIGDRIILLTRNHDCSYVNESLDTVYYGILNLGVEELAKQLLRDDCTEAPVGGTQWIIDPNDVDLRFGKTNITATYNQSDANGNSFWALDTSDIIYNPYNSETGSVEVVATNRNGGGEGKEHVGLGMSLNLWSISASKLARASGLTNWKFEATLLQRVDRTDLGKVDGFHPGGSIVKDGYQRIYLYTGKGRVGERTAVAELKRTLDTPKIAAAYRERNAFTYIQGDFNGDGLMDFLKAYEDWRLNQVYIADPHAPFIDPYPGFVPVDNAAPNYYLFRDDNTIRTISADFDGDGRDDLLRLHANPKYNRVFLSNGSTGLTPAFPRSEAVLPDFVLHDAEANRLTLTGDFDGDGAFELIRMVSNSTTNDILDWDGLSFVRRLGISYRLYSASGSVRPASGNFSGDERDELIRLYHTKTMHRMFEFSGTGQNLALKGIRNLPPYYLNSASGPFRSVIADFGGDAHVDIFRMHETPSYNRLFISDDECPPQGGAPPCNNGFRVVDAPDYYFYKSDGSVQSIIGNFGGDSKADVFRVQADPEVPDDRDFYKLFISNTATGIGGGALYSNNVSAFFFLDEQMSIETLVGDIDGDGKDDLVRNHESSMYDDVFVSREDHFEDHEPEILPAPYNHCGRFCIQVDSNNQKRCEQSTWINVDCQGEPCDVGRSTAECNNPLCENVPCD